MCCIMKEPYTQSSPFRVWLLSPPHMPMASPISPMKFQKSPAALVLSQVTCVFSMVNLVLDNLCRPAGKGLKTSLKLLVLILHLNRLPAFGFPGPCEGETALLRLWPPAFHRR